MSAYSRFSCFLTFAGRPIAPEALGTQMSGQHRSRTENVHGSSLSCHSVSPSTLTCSPPDDLPTTASLPFRDQASQKTDNCQAVPGDTYVIQRAPVRVRAPAGARLGKAACELSGTM